MLSPNSEITISLDDLLDNVRRIKSSDPEPDICAVVKSNAYGHGLLHIANSLYGANVRHFAVATIDEAVALRKAGISEALVLLFASDFMACLDEIYEHKIAIVVYSLTGLKSLLRHATKPVSVHIEIDTGMGRTGIDVSELSTMLRLLDSSKIISFDGILTHFSCADIDDQSYSIMQKRRFQGVLDELMSQGRMPKYIHSENSPAALNINQPQCNLKRIGLMLYGVSPVAESIDIDLKPILSWTTKIVQIKKCVSGSSISYGATWTAARDSVIATVPVGYADGYPRLASNKGFVVINDTKCPIVGIVCMDFMMIDVTDCKDIDIDSAVVLIGAQETERVSVDDIASWAMTIPYETLCHVGKRSRIKYVGGG